jgi:hypothetical protein
MQCYSARILMTLFAKIMGGALRRRMVFAVSAVILACITMSAHAQCPGCVTFNPGVVWGTNSFTQLNEASGLAASTRNPGVVWSHNDDGDDGANNGARLLAFRTNGTGLARFNINITLTDVEDMAIGPGPVAGVQYLYVGDIGGANSVRNEIRVVRIPEPTISQFSSGNPPSIDFAGVQVFTLKYPTGIFWDAETLFVDPLNGDVYVGTKHETVGTWIYRVNLNAALPGSTNTMEFVLTVPFYDASGGAISPDGSQIALRNEFSAKTWLRCPDDTISNALARAGQSIPVIGTPTEPNGEAIAFLPGGRGYLTVSDNSEAPPLYYFSSTCAPTVITQQPQSITNSVGANALFTAEATGENLSYQWRFNSSDLAGETANVLFLTNIQPANAGPYTLRVVGNGGAVTSNPAWLGVSVLPPVINSQPPALTYAPTGSTVQIAVGVQGTAPFHYSWARGRKLMNQDSPVLTFNNVQRTNAGKYRVTITNSMSKAISSYANLKVLFPPSIISQPLARTNASNTTAIFRVRAKGSAPMRYQWYFNDVAISNATRSTLKLPRVQPTNSGLYSVRVTNYVGTNFSAPAQLTVP